jgi:metal-responsive CopG/Arc/MetJ family transcriptional regulator
VNLSLEVGQLERLNEAADRARVSRSMIVRDAIERELKRYEKTNELEEPLREASGNVLSKTTTRP